MPTYEVVVKSVPAMRVASLRGIIPTYSQQAQLWDELEPSLAQNGVRPTGACLTLYHDAEYKEQGVDAEVCEPIDANWRGSDHIRVYDLPTVATMASVVHHGAFNALSQAYNALMQWIQTNGYRISGATREIYLKSAEPVRQDDPSYVAEIQIPVEKA